MNFFHRLCRVIPSLAVIFFSTIHLARADEPQILGSLRYSNQVNQAMQLLKVQDTNAYAILTNYVGRIREGERSGMRADQVPPTYEMSDRTAFYSVTWCAATMAHDSFHSKLYQDYRQAHSGPVPEAVWTGTEAEQKCMRHQLSVMRRIGASPGEIAHAEKMADGHYVKDHETLDDYKKRSW